MRGGGGIALEREAAAAFTTRTGTVPYGIPLPADAGGQRSDQRDSDLLVCACTYCPHMVMYYYIHVVRAELGRISSRQLFFVFTFHLHPI